jgi:hypothetical protein
MRPGPVQKLQRESTSQARGARNGREQTKATPALPRQRTSRSRRLKIPTPDISTAVERKNDPGRPERESIERKHAVHEQVRRRPAVTPAPHVGAQPSAASPDHPNETVDYGPLMKALGTMGRDFVDGLLGQLYSASARGADKFDAQGLFSSLAVIEDAKPKDALVAMHVAQMAAVHAAMMRAVGQLARAEDLPHRESATRALNQLARTYTAQLEGLKRYRTGGDQRLAVQNVSVNQGAQAIVTNVNHARHGAVPEELANTTPALTDAWQPAMEILGESERIPVPLRTKSKT